MRGRSGSGCPLSADTDKSSDLFHDWLTKGAVYGHEDGLPATSFFQLECGWWELRGQALRLSEDEVACAFRKDEVEGCHKIAPPKFVFEQGKVTNTCGDGASHQEGPCPGQGDPQDCAGAWRGDSDRAAGNRQSAHRVRADRESGLERNYPGCI